MNVAQLIHQFLQEKETTQLATVRQGKPWICTVHFVWVDGKMYWLSLPTRRHSQDIATDDRVAMAVAVKTDMPVIGIQMEGRARLVADVAEVERVMTAYIAKHGKGDKFVELFKAGTNEHALYVCEPQNIVLFDEVHFAAGEGRQEIAAAELAG